MGTKGPDLRDGVLLASKASRKLGAPWHPPPREQAMHAFIGDRIVVRSTHDGGPGRDGEIIEVERANGRPPYRVRWHDTGHVSLFFPGPDAYVDRGGRSVQLAYAEPAQVG
jgi:hypothetical protein